MKKKTFRLYLQNEHGYTLIIVTLLIVVISILGLSLMATTATTLKQSDGERNNQSSFYIAEAGLVQKKKELQDKIEAQKDKALIETKKYYDSLKDIDKKTFNYKEFLINTYYSMAEQVINKSASLSTVYSSSDGIYEPQFGKPTQSIVTVTKVGSRPLNYTIQSIGTIGTDNKKARTVMQNFEVIATPIPPNKTIFTAKSPLYVETPFVPKNTGNGNTFNIKDKNGNFAQAITGIPSIPSFNPGIPSTGATSYRGGNPLVLSSGDKKYYKSLSLNGNGMPIIQAHDNGSAIYVDSLSLDGNINITGNGNLTIYVQNNLSISKGTIVKNTSVKNDLAATKLTIIYTGTNGIHITGNLDFYGLFVAPYAELKGNGNGGAKFYGTVVVKSVFKNSAGTIQYMDTDPLTINAPSGNDVIYDNMTVKIEHTTEVEK